MREVELETIPIGSILAEDVIINNSIKFNKGTVISEMILNQLVNSNNTKIKVKIESIFDGSIDKSKLDIYKLSNLIYQSLKRLDVNESIMCARQLIISIIQGSCNNILSTLYNYSPETYIHCQNVATLAIIVGLKCNLSLYDFKCLAIGAFLHDIGKMMIPYKILVMKNKLSDKERDIVNQHPLYGYDVVKQLDYIPINARRVVLEHHENYNGTGYPYGKRGIESLKISRIVHICDVYEALCSKRSYKDSMSRKECRSIIEEEAGTMFDKKLVSKFLEIIPTYLVGEEIISDGRIAVVYDSSNRLNPVINTDGQTMTVDNFISSEKGDN